jgi:hypothetical protein
VTFDRTGSVTWTGRGSMEVVPEKQKQKQKRKQHVKTKLAEDFQDKLSSLAEGPSKSPTPPANYK